MLTLEQVITKHKQTLTKSYCVDTPHEPWITVFRNTGFEGQYVEDTGENATDLFLFYNGNIKTSFMCMGRSTPNKSYLQKFFSDDVLSKNERFNYIAPGFYRNALAKGFHKGRPALVQNKKYFVIRSLDEILGDDDDYGEYGWQGDNLHGWLKSLGCLVVDGNMGKRGSEWHKAQLTGDWEKVYEWVYETNNYVYYNVNICSRNEFMCTTTPHVKFGSECHLVREVQEELNLQQDGVAGQLTITALIDAQSGMLKREPYALGVWCE